MHPLLVVARHEYRSNIRRRGFLSATFLLPSLALLFLLFMAFQVGSIGSDAMSEMLQGSLGSTPLTELELPERDAPTTPVGVVDQAGLLAEDDDETLRLFEEEAAARAALAQGEIRALFVLPRDYLVSGEVRLYVPGSVTPKLLVEAEMVRAALVEALATRLTESDPALLRRASDPMRLATVLLNEDPAQRFKLLISFALAGFLLSTMMSASQLFLVGVSEEKENRVIEMLLASMSPGDLLAGKVLGLGALGLTQVAIWMAMGSLPFLLLGVAGRAALAELIGPTRPLAVLLPLLYFLLGYLLYGSLATVIGAFGTRPAESQPIFTWFFLFLVAPFGVALNPEGGAPRLLSYFPLTAPTMMILRLGQEEVPLVDILGSLLLLLLAIPLVLWAGGHLFRRSLLRYSKIPPWRRYVLLGLGGVLLLLVPWGIVYQRRGEANDLHRYPPPGRMVDVGGYRLHLHCLGKGSPTVLLEADSGGNTLHWFTIQGEVARHTRTCAYDRAGLGWSDASPQPRRAQPIVEELHALLTRSEEQGPFVLVAQGLGGAYARLYASQHPEQVVGLVLVDPAHEAQPTLASNERERASQLRLLALLMRLGVLRAIGERGDPPALFAAHPPALQPMLYALFLRPAATSTMVAELEGEDASLALLEQNELPDDLPLWVLTPGEARVPGLTVEQSEVDYLTRLALHAELAARSTRGRHLVAEGGDPNLPLARPEMVIEAILDALAATRE